MSIAALERIAPQRYRSTTRTHAGARRSVNEDRLLDRPDAGLWAVADGMGGQRAGDVAASRVVNALAGVRHDASAYACLADIVREVEGVNAALFGEGRDGGALSGATLVALLIHDGYYACLWAGDSRAYLLRNGGLTQLTRDHSLVQEMVESGAITEAERKAHPRGHVITRAVGAGPKIEMERRFATLEQDDVFLLCSDGLTACFEDHEILDVLRDHSLDDAADLLLETALSRHASDNVSFVLVEAAT